MSAFATETEDFLAKYFDGRHVAWKYEVRLAEHCPDFTARHPSGTVIYEVSEFRMDARKDCVGAFDPYKRIRQKLRDKRRQAKDAKGALPFVLVLRSAGGGQPTDQLSMVGALFGDIAITAPLNPATGAFDFDAGRTEATRNGRFRPWQGTRYSAVAVLEKFNPTRIHWEQLYKPRIEGVEDPHEMYRVISAAQVEAIAKGLFVPGTLATRLRVYHNPWAGDALPRDAVTGPFDEQWAADDRGCLGAVFLGERIADVPGRWQS